MSIQNRVICDSKNTLLLFRVLCKFVAFDYFTKLSLFYLASWLIIPCPYSAPARCLHQFQTCLSSHGGKRWLLARDSCLLKEWLTPHYLGPWRMTYILHHTSYTEDPKDDTLVVILLDGCIHGSSGIPDCHNQSGLLVTLTSVVKQSPREYKFCIRLMYVLSLWW